MTLLPPGATTVVIRTTATGIGTHLGQFSLIREITGNLVNFTATGSAHWIAANGDSIYTTIVGQAELSDIPGGFLKVTEIHTITGGTGRFAGAQGSFTVELFHKLATQWGSRWRRNARHLRLIPRDHYFPGRSSLRRLNLARRSDGQQGYLTHSS